MASEHRSTSPRTTTSPGSESRCPDPADTTVAGPPGYHSRLLPGPWGGRLQRGDNQTLTPNAVELGADALPAGEQTPISAEGGRVWQSGFETGEVMASVGEWGGGTRTAFAYETAVVRSGLRTARLALGLEREADLGLQAEKIR